MIAPHGGNVESYDFVIVGGEAADLVRARSA
jgi:hypothetical protein